jgi:hypothetical protein
MFRQTTLILESVVASVVGLRGCTKTIMNNRTFTGKQVLRLVFATALRYHPQYGMGEDSNYYYWHHTISKGGKLPSGIHCVAGDVFAYYYNELRLDPNQYEATIKEFFEK